MLPRAKGRDSLTFSLVGMKYTRLTVLWLLIGITRASGREYHATTTGAHGSSDSSSSSPVNLTVATRQEVNCSTSNICRQPWQYCAEGMCTCGPQTFPVGLQCKVGENLTLLSNCITINQSSYSTYVGNCVYQNIFNWQSQQLPNTPHVLDELLCGRYFNRTGILCGECKDGHYPRAYSFDELYGVS